MKLAFATLLVVFLLLPGIFFRYGYLKRDGLQILSRTKFYVEFLFAFIISLFFHFISFLFYEGPLNGDFDTGLLFNALASDNPMNVEDNEGPISYFIFYNLVLSVLLFLIGWGINRLMTRKDYKFSENFQFLDYTGNWDRIFTFERNPKEKYTLPTIDALVEIGGKLTLYTGILLRYYIDKNGYIDKIILRDVSRIGYEDFDKYYIKNSTKESKNDKIATLIPENLSKKDKEELEKVFASLASKVKIEIPNMIEIKGSHHFVVYGSTIKNINIRYE